LPTELINDAVNRFTTTDHSSKLAYLKDEETLIQEEVDIMKKMTEQKAAEAQATKPATVIVTETVPSQNIIKHEEKPIAQPVCDI